MAVVEERRTRRSSLTQPLLQPTKLPETWEALLTTAILNVLFSDDNKSTSTSSPSWPPQDRSPRNPLLPSVSVQEDGDSALGTDELDSVSSIGYTHNWFLKGNRVSPFGSVRSQCSQRVPLTAPSFLKAFEVPFDSLQSKDESDSEWESRAEGDEEEEEAGPEFLELPESVECEEGELVIMSCRLRVRKTEETEVRWYSASRELEDDGGRVRLVSGPGPGQHSLELFDVEEKDSGEVVVVAVNGVSVRTAVATLEVRKLELAGEEPWFLDEAEVSMVGKEGEEVRMNLRCLGYPIPRLTFHRGPVRLAAEEGWKVERGTGGHWTLILIKARVEHSSQISALAVNRCGRAVARFALSVSPKDAYPLLPA